MNKWFKLLLMMILIAICVYHLLNTIIDLKPEKIRFMIRNSSIYKRTIGFTNKRIMESNITHYIKYYSTAVHFILAFLSFGLGYFLLSTYPVRFRVILATIMFLIPWLALQIVDYKTNALTKKQTGYFIISFKEMYYIEDDIFPAFKKLEENLSYPIVKAVEHMNKKYSVGISAEECFDVFKDQFSNEMMRTFITQLSVAYETGGSVDSICENFLSEISRIEETEDKDKLNQIMDRYGIYMILAFNILMMHLGMQRRVFLNFVTETTVGQVTLLCNYLLTAWIFIKMLKSS